MTTEKRKEYLRQWAKKNPDKVKASRIKMQQWQKEYSKQYAVDNKDSISAKQKEWYLKNKTKKAEQCKSWYEQNKAKKYTQSQEWRKKNLDKVKASALKSKRKSKLNAYEFVNFVKSYLGCADCGLTNCRVLQLHHLDQTDKKYNLGEMTGRGYSISTIKQEMKKGVILCANCHILRHFSEKTGNFHKSL